MWSYRSEQVSADRWLRFDPCLPSYVPGVETLNRFGLPHPNTSEFMGESRAYRFG